MAKKKNTTKNVIEPVKLNIIQDINDKRNKEKTNISVGSSAKTVEPISPTERKKLAKQKQDRRVKQNLTQDYAYTGIPGAIAEPAGVTIPAPKKPKLALRGGGRAYGKNS